MLSLCRQTARHAALCCLLFLAACSSSNPTGSFPFFSSSSSNDDKGTYKVGEPYQINGIWYYPNEDYSYDETGIASWYGPGFHGGKTANGERFDTNELTAAHPTLPMPSLARVTNLDNGRSLVVRINDRGPFSGGRLIDVSRRAAQMLGFESSGTAKVRVQVLADESRAIAAAARRYGAPQAEQAYASATVSSAPVPKVAVQELPDSKPYSPPRVAPEPVAQDRAKPVELPVVTKVPVKPNPQIYVQAGAFTMPENARKLQKDLDSLGQVKINYATINEIKFYRVRIGPLADADKAAAMLKRVNQSGVTEARIVVD